jgi:hypothetical protein
LLLDLPCIPPFRVTKKAPEGPCFRAPPNAGDLGGRRGGAQFYENELRHAPDLFGLDREVKRGRQIATDTYVARACQAFAFAVNSIPSAFITASVVLRVGLPFSLNER